jgi:hypothetical protein
LWLSSDTSFIPENSFPSIWFDSNAACDIWSSLLEARIFISPFPSFFLPAVPQEQKMVKAEIRSTDRMIDTLVYELDGLSADEIKIVEGYWNSNSLL